MRASCHSVNGFPMVLIPDDSVKVESELYSDLRKELGKNFELFANTVRLVEWKKKGPYVPPEAKMGSTKNMLAFPPLISRWSMKQSDVVVKDTGKAIRINQKTLEQLQQTLGQKKVDILRDEIGFDERPNRDMDVRERDIDVFHTAWGKGAEQPNYELNGTWSIRRPHPVFKDTVNVSDMATIQLGKLDDDRRNLVGVGARVPAIAKFRPKSGPQAPHASKVNGKFFWYNPGPCSLFVRPLRPLPFPPQHTAEVFYHLIPRLFSHAGRT